MSTLTIIEPASEAVTLPALVRRAADQFASAESSAEVLEARDAATLVYDAAKRAGRFAKAKSAHDDVIAAVYRAQADALEIESLAKRRLADEYDAAQERGEVQRHGGQGKKDIPDKNIPSVADIGLTAKDVHEAREIRGAEEAYPGIVRRTLDSLIEAGEEPTKAALRRAILPTPSEARKIARDEGRLVEASDGKLHDGRAPDEIRAEAQRTEIIFRCVNALEALATMPESAAAYLMALPDYMHDDIARHLPVAESWIAELSHHWRKRHAA